MLPKFDQSSSSTAPPVISCMRLRDKIAAELDQLREDMEEIGVQLCLDEEVMLRCMSYLQRLDEMGQRSNWLAALLFPCCCCSPATNMVSTAKSLAAE